MLGFMLIRSSPLSRSTHSIQHTGYIVLDPDSRGQHGLVRSLICWLEYFGKSLGYLGLLSRTAITSRNIYPAKKQGAR